MSTAAEVSHIENSCQEIMACISGSSLNYSVNLTPYSMYITVRKSYSKKQVPSHPNNDEIIASLKQHVSNLEANLKKSETDRGKIQSRLQDAVKDSEELQKEIKLLREQTFNLKKSKVCDESIKQNKAENFEIRETLENFESDLKEMKKALGLRDKDIYNLRKENKIKDDKLKHLKATLDEQTATMKRENKKQANKLKKQEKKTS